MSLGSAPANPPSSSLACRVCLLMAFFEPFGESDVIALLIRGFIVFFVGFLIARVWRLDRLLDLFSKLARLSSQPSSFSAGETTFALGRLPALLPGNASFLSLHAR